MIETHINAHVFSCFDKDIYVDMKQPRIGYTNIITGRVFGYLYAEYGEKMEELQNKVIDDLEEEVDITGLSIKPFWLKQENCNYSSKTGNMQFWMECTSSCAYESPKSQLHQQSRRQMASKITL